MPRAHTLVGLPVRDNLPVNGVVLIAGDVVRSLGVPLRAHYMAQRERELNAKAIETGVNRCDAI